jgi:organic hydroperoxide reductase OsmC/OhrA
VHMKGQPERDFVVNLKYEGGYRFSSQASEDDRLHGEPYVSDEPDPVGEASGPATPALLGSAVTHCLSASLLEALRHARVEVLDFEAEAVAVVKPNAEGNPRIDHIDVTLRPRLAQGNPRMNRCAEVFENYCTVTSSVKRGIDVRVGVDWSIDESDEAPAEKVPSKEAQA